MKNSPQELVRRTRGRDTYDALKESVYQALLPQTRLKPYYDAINLYSRLTPTATGLEQNYTCDFSDVQALFSQQFQVNPEKAGATNDASYLLEGRVA